MNTKKDTAFRYAKIGLLFFLGLYITTSYGQQKPRPIVNAALEGTVIDAITKKPLEGVTLQLEAVTHSVKTDRDGKFQFVTGQKLPFSLTISSVGYEKRTLVISTSPALISLEPSKEELDEVVVVGYGVIKRKDLTGAVSSVSESALKQPVSSIDQALKGAAAGVQVTQTSGQPGGGVSIRIRGGASVQGGNEPLYVIDGFPIYN